MTSTNSYFVSARNPLVESDLYGHQTLLNLTLSRIHRFKKFRELGDVNPITEHGHLLEAYNVPHQAVPTSMLDMLATRVKANVGDALEDINEMVILCRGFGSGTSPCYLTSSLQALTAAVLDAYSHGKQIQGLDQAIECFGESLKTCPPGSHQVRVSFDLADLLAVRFLVLSRDVDANYEEAKVLLKPLTCSPSPGHPPRSYRHQASGLEVALGHSRSIVNPNHGNIKVSIPHCRSFLDHCPLSGNPPHPIITDLQPLQGAKLAHSNVGNLPSGQPSAIPTIVYVRRSK